MRDYWGQASGKQQWPQYRHRYTSLVYKPSAGNTNLEWNTHIYSHARLKASCNLSHRNFWVTGPTNTFHHSILALLFPSHLVSSAQFWEPHVRSPLTWQIQQGLDVKTQAAAGSEEYKQRFYCPEGRVCERDEGLITAQQLCNSPPWYSTRAENLTRLAQSKDGLVFLT